MSETARAPFTVRLRAADRIVLAHAAEQSGLEAATAARQVLELMIKRLRTDGDYLTALCEMRDALDPVLRSSGQTATR